MLVKSILLHLEYVAISVAVGFTLGLLLGILLSRIPKFSALVMGIISLLQTIPGLVFIGVLFIYVGMKPISVIIALSIYAMFPVLKNTYVGIMGVDKGYVEAATGCGMSPMQTMLRVQLPLALPHIISGLRMATIYTVSWAVLAAMIGQGGLGDFIYRGVDSNNNVLIIGGAVPAALIAIGLGALIDRLQKRVSPGSTRGGEKA